MASWAYLNEEGKKLWGDIFPDGRIPVVSMVGQLAVLGDREEPEPIYMIRTSDLTPDQFGKILDKVSKNFSANREEVKTNFEKENIPLRQSLTSGAGTDNPGIFFPDYDDSYDDSYDEEIDGEEDFDEEDQDW